MLPLPSAPADPPPGVTLSSPSSSRPRPPLAPRRRRARALTTLVTAVCAAALALPLAAGTAAAAPAPVEPPVPVLVWTDCGDGFQCATAAVPLDHDRPAAGTIELALIKRPATDPARRLGSLFTNPGGPGAPGTAFVRNASAALDPEVLASFDVIGFDPRGVGASTPLRCFSSAEEQAAFFDPNRLSQAPVTPAEQRVALGAAIELGARCVARNPQLAQHLSTANVARDMRLLMRAVGDDRLNYYGLSYGTYLGATFAALFPDEVRTLVLDGVLEPDAYTGAGPEGRRTPTFVRAASDIGTSETLGAFLDLCAQEGPQRCAFAEGGDPRAKFDEIAARLRAAPLVLPDPQSPTGSTTVTYGVFVGGTTTLLYVDAQWPILADLLQQLHVGGRPEVTADLVRAAQAAAEPEAVPYSNQPEALRAIVCADTDNPRNPRLWPRLEARADERSPYFGRYWAAISQPCATWPARDRDRYTGPFDVPTAAPALVVGTEFDPATPLRNSEALADLLPGAGLVTLRGYGHTSFAQGGCITTTVGKYLVTGELPADGTTCTPDRLPFDPLPGDPAAQDDAAARAAAVQPVPLG